MAKYNICFTQYWGYEVEAEDEKTAFDLALEDFHYDMFKPVAYPYYDEVEIEEIEED